MISSIEKSPGILFSVIGVIMMLTTACGSIAQDPPQWEPGKPYPKEGLKKFPCHDYTKPCGDITAPKIEKVTYSGPKSGDPELGEKIAINVRWGNCIACHSLPDGNKGGEIGPDLSNYGARNMDFNYTFQRIWDVRFYNPNAHMPVYGPNNVLSVKDIRDVIAFLETGK